MVRNGYPGHAVDTHGSEVDPDLPLKVLAWPKAQNAAVLGHQDRPVLQQRQILAVLWSTDQNFGSACCRVKSLDIADIGQHLLDIYQLAFVIKLEGPAGFQTYQMAHSVSHIHPFQPVRLSDEEEGQDGFTGPGIIPNLGYFRQDFFGSGTRTIHGIQKLGGIRLLTDKSDMTRAWSDPGAEGTAGAVGVSGPYVLLKVQHPNIGMFRSGFIGADQKDMWLDKCGLLAIRTAHISRQVLEMPGNTRIRKFDKNHVGSWQLGIQPGS